MNRPVSIAALTTSLTPRDYELLELLDTHPVMTTGQIGRFLFTGAQARPARTRLLRLYRGEVLERFRPRAASGSAALHWALGPAGAQILAYRRGGTADKAGRYRARAQALAYSSKLGHILGLAETHIAFALAARATPEAALQCWYGEAECARRWDRWVRPDAYLRWRQDEAAVDGFVEYDMGTEALKRVAAKMSGYARLAEDTRLPSRVLLCAPSPSREAHLAHALAPESTPQTPVWLTTHAHLRDPGPAQSIWRPARGGPRRRIADLAD